MGKELIFLSVLRLKAQGQECKPLHTVPPCDMPAENTHKQLSLFGPFIMA